MVSTANGLRICHPRYEWTESIPLLMCVKHMRTYCSFSMCMHESGLHMRAATMLTSLVLCSNKLCVFCCQLKHHLIEM